MRERPFLLGLDVGTTHIKGLLFDPQVGRIVSQHHTPTPSYEPRPGWQEYDATALWGSVSGCISALVETMHQPGYAAAVATASMGEAGTLYDTVEYDPDPNRHLVYARIRKLRYDVLNRSL